MTANEPISQSSRIILGNKSEEEVDRREDTIDHLCKDTSVFPDKTFIVF